MPFGKFNLCQPCCSRSGCGYCCGEGGFYRRYNLLFSGFLNVLSFFNEEFSIFPQDSFGSQAYTPMNCSNENYYDYRYCGYSSKTIGSTQALGYRGFLRDFFVPSPPIGNKRIVPGKLSIEMFISKNNSLHDVELTVTYAPNPNFDNAIEPTLVIVYNKQSVDICKNFVFEKSDFNLSKSTIPFFLESNILSVSDIGKIDVSLADDYFDLSPLYNKKIKVIYDIDYSENSSFFNLNGNCDITLLRKTDIRGGDYYEGLIWNCSSICAPTYPCLAIGVSLVKYKMCASVTLSIGDGQANFTNYSFEPSNTIINMNLVSQYYTFTPYNITNYTVTLLYV